MVKKNPFHLVERRPWPIAVSFSIFCLLLNLVFFFHNMIMIFWVFFFFFFLSFFLFFWWRDVVLESFVGYHKNFVINKFYVGMLLMIISEVFFFFRFFWAFFHKCWFPGIELGSVWPPKFMKAYLVDSFSVPLLNTILLLSSGVTITWAHHRLLKRKEFFFNFRLFITISLGIFFLFFQNFEYSNLKFSFKTLIFGSCFYMLTGFHGGHVIVGTLFLLICLFRSLCYHFSSKHHVGLELAIWYWHFVDVVWLFLFIFVYLYRRLK